MSLLCSLDCLIVDVTDNIGLVLVDSGNCHVVLVGKGFMEGNLDKRSAEEIRVMRKSAIKACVCVSGRDLHSHTFLAYPILSALQRLVLLPRSAHTPSTHIPGLCHALFACTSPSSQTTAHYYSPSRRPVSHRKQCIIVALVLSRDRVSFR